MHHLRLTALILLILGTLAVRLEKAPTTPILTTLPTITTDPVTNLSDTTATLNATVDPGGLSTSVTFAWGTDPIYDVRSSPPIALSTNRPTSVSYSLSGLRPGVRYFVQAVASNASGTARGIQRTFVTLGIEDQGADLSVAQLDTLNASVGMPLTYTITVRNAGPLPAASTILTATLPDSAQIIHTNPTPPTCRTALYAISDIFCLLGELPVGARAIIQMVVIPRQAGSITSTVSVNSSTFDPNRLNNTDRLVSQIAAAPLGTSAELILSQQRGGTLTLTSTSGLTLTLVVPAGAVRKPTTLIFTDLPAGPTRPLNRRLVYMGRSFEIETFQDGVIQPDFQLDLPATLTMQYAPTLTATERLLLLRYNLREPDPARAWQTVGIPRQRVDLNQIQATVQQFGEFALVRTLPVQPFAYLPLVRRTANPERNHATQRR